MKTRLLKRFRKEASKYYYIEKLTNTHYVVVCSINGQRCWMTYHSSLEDATEACRRSMFIYIKSRVLGMRVKHKKQIHPKV